MARASFENAAISIRFGDTAAMRIHLLYVVGVWLLLAFLAVPPAGADVEGELVSDTVTIGAVASAPPSTIVTPDGWTLTVSGKDETQMPVPPLTTATSSRSYIAGGTFTGAITGDGRTTLRGGKFEAGYQIGCGVEVADDGIGFTTPRVYQVTVLLHPGVVNTIPVAEHEFKGTNPRATITRHEINMDNCVGQSFIRSYATLTSVTDDTQDVISYMGVTKAV